MSENRIFTERYSPINNDDFYLHNIAEYKVTEGATSEILILHSAGWSECNPEYYRSALKNGYVFEYIIRGTGYVEYDGNTYKVTPGDFIVAKYGHKYTFYTSKEDFCIKLFFEASGSYIDAIHSILHTGNIFIKKCEVQKIFEDIIYSSHVNNVDMKGLAYKIFDLCACAFLDKTSKNIYEVKLSDVLAYIDLNISTTLQIETVSQHFGMTKSSFRSYLKDNFHISYKNYVVQRRVDVAAYMLVRTNITITEIAYICGFFDQCHFSSSFKEKFGISPGSYRKNAGTVLEINNTYGSCTKN